MARRKFPTTAFWIAVAVAYAVFSLLAKSPPRDWGAYPVPANIAWAIGFCLPSIAIIAGLLVFARRRRRS